MNKIISLTEFNENKNTLYKEKDWEFTSKRRKSNYYIYSPSTYEHDMYSRYAYGSGINLSYDDLVKLAKEKPEAYVNFLVSDGYSQSWLQAKNICIKVFNA